MKSKRHLKILEIISKKDIYTQEELSEELRQAGFDVTQSTVSRDIKTLRLMKTQDYNGIYKYSAPQTKENNKINTIIANLIVYVENIDKMVVVKTVSAGAAPVAEAIDGFGFSDIAGTIAGENTIFIMLRTDEAAEKLVSEIEKLI